MAPRKRPSSVPNRGARDQPKVSPDDVEETSGPDDALALAQEAEAEAEAAEAAAQAAGARARALRLRRQAETAAAKGAPAAVVDAPAPAIDHDMDTSANDVDAPAVEQQTADEAVDDIDDIAEADESVSDMEDAAEPERRRLKLPRIRLKWVAASLVVLCTFGFLGASAYMLWSHRQIAEEQQRSEEFAAAARQGVVTLMSLNFNNAADDVKRIVDNTTGDFKKDFQGHADEFIKSAQEAKVVVDATVTATAVQSMTKDSATVLVAVTTHVSNAVSKQQGPRVWRLRVDMVRDGEQLKMAKVEFVP